MKEENRDRIKLSPTMSAQEMDRFIEERPPQGISKETIKRGLSCEGHARAVFETLKGKAKIYYIRDKETTMAHAFVVPDDAKNDDLAYGNEFKGEHWTVGRVKKQGKDITKKTLERDWDGL